MTAISAAFADFRIVKGRKVAQFVFETPLEAADEALRMLGGLPRPDAERWVGIAPLKAKPTAVPAPVANEAPPKKRRPLHTLPRSQQAAIRINDEDFRRWWNGGADTLEEHVDAGIKANCGIVSKRELNISEAAAAKWDHIEDRYQKWRKANRPVETEERT